MDGNEVSTLTNLINDYGPYAVILAVVLTILVYLIISMNKNFKDMQDTLAKSNREYIDSITEQNTRMMEQVFENMNQKHEMQDITHEKFLLDTFSKLGSSIKHSCSETLYRTDANRIAIYLFHNGTHSFNGISFLKMTCICEKVLFGSGIVEHSIEHSNIPINLFDEMVVSLVDSGYYLIKNDDECHTKNCRMFVSSNKIRYSQAVCICDLNNKILGFVLAEFAHEYDETVAESEKDDLYNLTAKIQPVLTFSEYSENTEHTNGNLQHD